MQINKLVSILVGIVLFEVGGCANTSGVWVENDRLYIEDPAFAANIEVVGKAICEKTPQGFLHAQVRVKNTNRTDYECQYQFEWIRANGMTQTHVETPWSPKLLHGREVVELDAVSPVQGSEDFRLKIRRYR